MVRRDYSYNYKIVFTRETVIVIWQVSKGSLPQIKVVIFSRFKLEISSAIPNAKKTYNAVIITDPKAIENKFSAAEEKLTDNAKDGRTVTLGFHISRCERLLS